MRFSLRLNNDLALDQYEAIGRLADESAIERIWVSHDLMLGSAPVIVTRIAAATKRVGLGVGLFNPYTMHPAEIAMAASALDEASDGRFALGMGAGATGFLENVGIAQSAPVATTRNAVLAVRALLEGESPAAAGLEGWEPGFRLRRPAPGIKIYLGATGPRMRRLAGEVGDGALALALPPTTFPSVREDIVGEFGARRPDFDLPACIWLSLATGAADADDAIAAKLGLYGPEMENLLEGTPVAPEDLAALRYREPGAELPPAIRHLGIVGDPDVAVRACDALVAAGASHISFGPPLGPDPVEAVGLLIDRVLTSLAR